MSSLCAWMHAAVLASIQRVSLVIGQYVVPHVWVGILFCAIVRW